MNFRGHDGAAACGSSCRCVSQNPGQGSPKAGAQQFLVVDGLRLIAWWMPTGGDPLPSRRHDVFVVQPQRDYGGATGRCLSYNLNAVGTPLKMLGPDLSAWIEQRNCLRADGVNCTDEGAFIAVAPGAGEPQV